MFSIKIASVKDWDVHDQVARAAAINTAEFQVRSILHKLRHSCFTSHNSDPLRGNCSYQHWLMLIWVWPVLEHARCWEKKREIFKLALALIQAEFPNRKTKDRHFWVQLPHSTIRLHLKWELRHAESGCLEINSKKSHQKQEWEPELHSFTAGCQESTAPTKITWKSQVCKERKDLICKIFLLDGVQLHKRSLPFSSFSLVTYFSC